MRLSVCEVIYEAIDWCIPTGAESGVTTGGPTVVQGSCLIGPVRLAHPSMLGDARTSFPCEGGLIVCSVLRPEHGGIRFRL